jgi:hypothetical protein
MTLSIWMNGELNDLESNLVGKKTGQSLPAATLAAELIVPLAQEIKEFFAIVEVARTSASLPSKTPRQATSVTKKIIFIACYRVACINYCLNYSISHRTQISSSHVNLMCGHCNPFLNFLVSYSFSTWIVQAC